MFASSCRTYPKNLLTNTTSAPPLQSKLYHIYNEGGKKQSIDKLLKGTQKDRWQKALSNKCGCLAQGNKHGVSATNKIQFIRKSYVLLNHTVTYAYFVCDHWPLKAEPWRVRCVVQGEKLHYPEHDTVCLSIFFL